MVRHDDLPGVAAASAAQARQKGFAASAIASGRVMPMSRSRWSSNCMSSRRSRTRSDQVSSRSTACTGPAPRPCAGHGLGHRPAQSLVDRRGQAHDGPEQGAETRGGNGPGHWSALHPGCRITIDRGALVQLRPRSRSGLAAAGEPATSEVPEAVPRPAERRVSAGTHQQPPEARERRRQLGPDLGPAEPDVAQQPVVEAGQRPLDAGMLAMLLERLQQLPQPAAEAGADPEPGRRPVGGLPGQELLAWRGQRGKRREQRPEADDMISLVHLSILRSRPPSAGAFIDRFPNPYMGKIRLDRKQSLFMIEISLTHARPRPWQIVCRRSPRSAPSRPRRAI